MPITDIGKFMLLPNTDRNAIHFALLSAHAGIRKVIVWITRPTRCYHRTSFMCKSTCSG